MPPNKDDPRLGSAANDSAAPIHPFEYVPADLDDAVERWLPTLRKMAAAWAFSQEVDDLLQDIWLELHRSWPAVISAQSPLAMALKIAKRRCNKFRRKRRIRLRLPFLRDAPLLAESPARDLHLDDPERRLAAAQEVILLQRILSRLSQRQREAFLWRRVYGLTGEEAAQLLGITKRAAYALEEEARMKIEAEWQRWNSRRGSGRP